jgi:hypothetical protein
MFVSEFHVSHEATVRADVTDNSEESGKIAGTAVAGNI